MENKALKKYCESKIKMLKKEFHIRLTQKEINHLESLESELTIDNYCHKLFMDKL